MIQERVQNNGSTTWHVSGVAETVNEETLKNHIESFDRTIRIRSVHIMQRQTAPKPTKVVTVQFETVEDGEKAYSLVNYTTLHGSELHLTVYRRSGLKDLVAGNVFVRNLIASTRSKELHDSFKDYGRILSCRVEYNTCGQCKGYGYIQYDTPESAAKAISEGNGKIINGKRVEVTAFKPKQIRNYSQGMNSRLFVKGIPSDYNDEQLKALFAPYGDIISAIVAKDYINAPENRGFGFVCFKKTEDAKVAEERLNNSLLERQRLYVVRAINEEQKDVQLREERYRTLKDCNVYVKKLPEEVDDNKLRRAFEIFGNVLSARVMVKQRVNRSSGNLEYVSKKFGFICFSRKEDAQKAVTTANTQLIFGRILYAEISLKKEKRRENFANEESKQRPVDQMVPPYDSMSHEQPRINTLGIYQPYRIQILNVHAYQIPMHYIQWRCLVQQA